MVRRSASLAPFMFVVAACASAARPAKPTETPRPEPPAADSPPDHWAVIGAPCAMPNGALAENAASTRVFLEVARFEGVPAKSLHPNEGGGLVLDPGDGSVTVHHVLAKNDDVKVVAWDTEPQVAGGATQQVHFDMKLIPHVIASSPPGVRVEVDLAGSKAAHTTLVLRDQQTTILDWMEPPASSVPRTIVAVTPYVLRDEADMQRLLACKRDAAAAAHRQSAAAPSTLPKE